MPCFLLPLLRSFEVFCSEWLRVRESAGEWIIVELKTNLMEVRKEQWMCENHTHTFKSKRGSGLISNISCLKWVEIIILQCVQKQQFRYLMIELHRIIKDFICVVLNMDEMNTLHTVINLCFQGKTLIFSTFFLLQNIKDTAIFVLSDEIINWIFGKHNHMQLFFINHDSRLTDLDT